MVRAGRRLRRLTRRSEFLRAARGRRAGRRAFTLQMAESADPAPGVGFTVSRKVGKAVERNRIRRRLRAASETCANQFEPQHDYVLVGRREALTASFSDLTRDLASAVRRVHAPKTESSRNPGR